jgi:hypothetical protein
MYYLIVQKTRINNIIHLMIKLLLIGSVLIQIESVELYDSQGFFIEYKKPCQGAFLSVRTSSNLKATL